MSTFPNDKHNTVLNRFEVPSGPLLPASTASEVFVLVEFASSDAAKAGRERPLASGVLSSRCCGWR